MSMSIEEMRRKIAESQNAAKKGNPGEQTPGQETPALAPISNVKTFPQGEKAGPGLTMQTTSALPASGGNATEGHAPAPNEANNSQAGGVDFIKDRGTPEEFQKRIPPSDSLAMANKSIEAVSNTGKMAENKNAAEQKQKVNQNIEEITGKPVMAAMEEMRKQELAKLDAQYEKGEIPKKYHTELKDRWKNIFNIIPKEDMGLFLMDFGLRMLATSGGDHTLGEQIGVSGMGALQGSQQRQKDKQAGLMSREQESYDRAYKAAALSQKGGGTQVESTQEGLIERQPDGTWAPIVDPKTGKTYQRQYAGQDGYKGEKAWLYDFGKRIGKSEEEIFDIINGAMPEQQRRDRYEELILKMIKDASFTDSDPVLGKKYRDFNAEDISKWIENMMGQRRGALR